MHEILSNKLAQSRCLSCTTLITVYGEAGKTLTVPVGKEFKTFK